MSVRDAEQQVDRARTQRGRANTRLAGKTAINIRHECRALFAAHQYESNRRLVNGIDESEVLLTRKSKDVLDSFILQTFNQELRNSFAGFQHVKAPELLTGC